MSTKLQNNNKDPTESYEFIEDIMEDESLPEDTKQDFYYKFGELYINDPDFRHKHHGGYIVFVKNKFYGTFPTREYIMENIKDKSKYIHYIGDRIDGYMYHSHFIKCPDDGFEKNTFSTHLKIKFECGYIHEQLYFLDSGCTNTSGFLFNY